MTTLASVFQLAEYPQHNWPVNFWILSQIIDTRWFARAYDTRRHLVRSKSTLVHKSGKKNPREIPKCSGEDSECCVSRCPGAARPTSFPHVQPELPPMQLTPMGLGCKCWARLLLCCPRPSAVPVPPPSRHPRGLRHPKHRQTANRFIYFL